MALAALACAEGARAGVCDDIARLENAGQLDGQLVPRAADPGFATEPFRSLASGFVGQFDADGDSRIDYAFAESSDVGIELYDAGGARLAVARDPEFDSRRDLYRWGELRGTYRRGGEVYWIWRGSHALGFVSLVTKPPERRERLVCEFATRPTPKRLLVSGTEPVCTASRDGDIEPIAFGPVQTGTGGVPSTENLRNPRAARADIDNDGAEETLLIGARPFERAGDCLQQVLRLARSNPGESGVRAGLGAALEGLTGDCGAELVPFRFRGSSYVQVIRGTAASLHQDVSVVRIQQDAPQSICAIEVRPTFEPLSEHERFLRESRELYVQPWDAALHRAGIAKAQLLLDNGWNPDGQPGQDPPLLRAISMDRADLLDLLLARGADPNRRDSSTQSPVERALWLQRPDMVERLYAAGATYELKERDVISAIEGDSSSDWSPVVLRFVRQRQGIPEDVVLAVVSRRPAMLDRLLDSGFSAEPGGRAWHAGRPAVVPWRIAAIVQDQPATRAKLVRLFERGKLRYETNSIAYYGTPALTWIAVRHRGSSLPIDDFHSFATAACVAFFKADCGPRELVAKAAEWVRTLPGDCPSPEWAALGDRSACAIAAFYRRGLDPNAEKLWLTSWGGAPGTSGFALSVSQLLEMHRLKHGAASAAKRR